MQMVWINFSLVCCFICFCSQKAQFKQVCNILSCSLLSLQSQETSGLHLYHLVSEQFIHLAVGIFLKIHQDVTNKSYHLTFIGAPLLN